MKSDFDNSVVAAGENFSVVHFDDCFDDSQAEAVVVIGIFAFFAGAVKAVEEVGQVFCGNIRPAVDYGQGYAFFVRGYFNFNGAVRTAVRNCIVKQVCEGAFQQLLFGKHQGVAVNLQAVAMLFKNNVQKFCGFVGF